MLAPHALQSLLKRRRSGMRFRFEHHTLDAFRNGLLEHRREGGFKLGGMLSLLFHIAGERRVLRHFGVNAPLFVGRKRAVDERHQGFACHPHGSTSSAASLPNTRWANASRARARRLVTVPIGTLRMSAASL